MRETKCRGVFLAFSWLWLLQQLASGLGRFRMVVRAKQIEVLGNGKRKVLKIFPCCVGGESTRAGGVQAHVS